MKDGDLDGVLDPKFLRGGLWLFSGEAGTKRKVLAGGVREGGDLNSPTSLQDTLAAVRQARPWRRGKSRSEGPTWLVQVGDVARGEKEGLGYTVQEKGSWARMSSRFGLSS